MPDHDHDPDHDVEKEACGAPPPGGSSPEEPPAPPKSSLLRLLYNPRLEARGIHRVLPHERHPPSSPQTSLTQISLLWFSINLAANNITLGMLGPSIFALPFLDSALCAVLGMLVGCLPVAYVATFGPLSGLRAMVLARYSMGWYGAKVLVVLNLIVLLGYCLLDAVIAGQILSAVSSSGSGGGMSVVVGIVVVALVTWAVTVFGYTAFHWYERYAWLPQLVVLCLLVGAAAPRFDLAAYTPVPNAEMDGRTLAGNRLSFFSLCLSAAVTYAGGAADFFVYYPAETPRVRVFLVTLVGLALSFTFAFLIGIGLASGAPGYAPWGEALATSQGALIVAGFEPLGGFGRFCGVVVAMGLVANMTAPTYVAGVDWQVLGGWCMYVPRVVWTTLGVVIYTVCAIAGREKLAEIFTNFLALMGYWVVIWIAIMLEEHLIVGRWWLPGRGWHWEVWDQRGRLPVGIAAGVAFCVGWAGAVLSMAQLWYVGPFAKEVGVYGADMGNYVGFAWAAVVYLPLRWLEVRRFGR